MPDSEPESDDDIRVKSLSSSPVDYFSEYYDGAEYGIANARLLSGDSKITYVEYVDLSKPFKINISSNRNYHRYLRITPMEDSSQAIDGTVCLRIAWFRGVSCPSPLRIKCLNHS